jgi:hypothetical protein
MFWVLIIIATSISILFWTYKFIKLHREQSRPKTLAGVQALLSGPLAPPYNGKFLIADHIQRWNDIVNNHSHVCIVAARNHSKTLFASFSIPIWKMASKAYSKGVVITATRVQAHRMMHVVKDELVTNSKFQWMSPSFHSDIYGSYILCSNGSRTYFLGLGDELQKDGYHELEAEWVVVDDGLNDETQYSEMVRQQDIDFFNNHIDTCKQVLVVGTTIHPCDLYATLREEKRYYYEEFPAIHEVALFPERYSLEDLKKFKKELGNDLYNREFLCKGEIK